MKITIVAAVARNGVIGRANDLPWYLPEDLKRFKKLTAGKIVLMGRKTFESILGRLNKPLPNRTNVVVTHNRSYEVPSGVLLFHTLEEAVDSLGSAGDIYIIGGGEIFRETIPIADRLEITHVAQDAPGDVYFPEIDSNQWKKVWEEPHDSFTFATYERIAAPIEAPQAKTQAGKGSGL